MSSSGNTKSNLEIHDVVLSQQALENSGLTEIPVQPEAQSGSEKLQTDAVAPASAGDGPAPSKILMTDTVVKKEKRSIIKKPPQMLGMLYRPGTLSVNYPLTTRALFL